MLRQQDASTRSPFSTFFRSLPMRKHLYVLIASIMAVVFTLASIACGGGSKKNETTVSVTGVTLTPAAITLAVGQTQPLTANVAPGNATNKTVTWASNPTGVVTVSANGTVTAVAAGNTTITVTTTDGGFTADCAVTVNPAPVSVTGVTVNPTTLNLQVGRTAPLTATVAPSNAANKAVTWISNPAGVVTVSANGTVTGVSVGNTTITVRTADGGFTADCAVTVTPAGPVVIPVTDVTISPTTLNLQVSQAAALTYTILPSDATNKDVTWNTSNANIAVVADGLVRAVAEGSATITVTTVDGGKTATCALTVSGVAVTGVSLRAKTALGIGFSETLTPTIQPSNATDKTVTWTCSDTDIATVSPAGLIKALSAGTAIITAKTADGGFEAECALSVVNIYVGGQSGNAFPVVWVNNQAQNLLTQEQIDNGVWGGANSVFVAENGDIYAAGYDSDNPDSACGGRVWKNGQPYLGFYDSNYVETNVRSIAVSGVDVYAAGSATDLNWSDVPMLWKNGVIQSLENNSSNSSAYSVAVSDDGNDVYAAGYAMDGDTYLNSAILWKNGEATILNQTGNAQAFSVAVSGSDVYVAGQYTDENWNIYAVIWKNGVMQPLEIVQGSYPQVTSSVASGEDVYVAGYYLDEDYATNSIYWKNGVAHTLGEGEAWSVFVIDDNAFVAGIALEPSPDGDWLEPVAVVWINGVPHKLPGLYGNAYSIFVTK
jgi:uncharacterized protein YjdB